jgi:hypothetical protein
MLRNVRAKRLDRLRNSREVWRLMLFGVVWIIYTVDYSSLMVGPFAVLTKKGIDLHMSLCCCVDRPVEADGLSVGA